MIMTANSQDLNQVGETRDSFFICKKEITDYVTETCTTAGKSGTTPRLKTGPSKNRERHLEDARHHPSEHPLPHPPHKTLKKPVLPHKHTPHSHPHGDELPPHTNPPGPIKPSKKMTKTGSKP